MVIYVLIGRKLHEDLRPALFALFSAAWLLPSMAGPLAAGTLAELTSWRITFGIVSIGAALSLIGLIRTTRTERPLETSADKPEDPRLLSRSMLWALLAAGAALALHLGGQSDGTVTTAAALLLGLPFLMLAASRLLPQGTLRLDRGAPRLVVIRAVLASSSGATEIFLVLYMQSHRGLSATVAGLVIAVGATGWAVGAWYQGHSQTDEQTDYRLITTGAVLVLAGPMAALLYVTSNAPLGVVVAGCALMGAGFGALYPRITSATLRLAPQEQHGRFSSGLQAGESMATAGVLALAGAAATTFAAPASFILINAFAVAAVAFAATLTLSRPPLQPAVVP